MGTRHTATSLHPELTKLREALRKKTGVRGITGPGGDPQNQCDRAERYLCTYAASRAVKVGVEVGWGNWDCTDEAEEIDAIQFVTVLDVTSHVPKIIRPDRAIQINHEICGNKVIPDYMADQTMHWGRAVIERIAASSALVPRHIAGPLLEWMTNNLQGSWNNDTLLDTEPRNFHPFFSGDRDRYNCLGVHCLHLDDEADRLLFRLRWF